MCKIDCCLWHQSCSSRRGDACRCLFAWRPLAAAGCCRSPCATAAGRWRRCAVLVICGGRCALLACLGLETSAEGLLAGFAAQQAAAQQVPSRAVQEALREAAHCVAPQQGPCTRQVRRRRPEAQGTEGFDPAEPEGGAHLELPHKMVIGQTARFAAALLSHGRAIKWCMELRGSKRKTRVSSVRRVTEKKQQRLCEHNIHKTNCGAYDTRAHQASLKENRPAARHGHRELEQL